MWKPEYRAAADRRGLRYPSDLTDPEWALVSPLIRPVTLPPSFIRGRVESGAAILDSQSVKTADQKGLRCGQEDPGPHAPDPDRCGRRLLAIEVHGADIQDRDGAKGVPKRSRRLRALTWTAAMRVASCIGPRPGPKIMLEVVKRSVEQVVFAVIRRRWVVDRTFAWIVK